MKYVFAIIFILSLAAGYGVSYINGLSLTGTVISLAVAGFAGSSIIAFIFVFLYFFEPETDKEKIERLKAEINQLKDIKRLEP